MAEYRNERVCLCVCLSVCERISGTTRPIVTSFRALLLFLPELANLRTFCTTDAIIIILISPRRINAAQCYVRLTFRDLGFCLI